MKRLTLEQVVAQAMDMFLRAYTSDTTFWDETNFTVNVIAYYAKLVNDAFDDKKQQNKNESGFSQAEITGSWFIEETVTVEKDSNGHYYFETSAPIFEFVFDGLQSALHSIYPVDPCDIEIGELIRVSNKDYWQLPRLPKTNNLYWMGILNKIKFPTAERLPPKLGVIFLPAMTLDSSCAVFPEPLITVTITTILQQMYGAANEMKVIDKSNDGNPNTIEQTEVNPDSLK